MDRDMNEDDKRKLFSQVYNAHKNKMTLDEMNLQVCRILFSQPNLK